MAPKNAGASSPPAGQCTRVPLFHISSRHQEILYRSGQSRRLDPRSSGRMRPLESDSRPLCFLIFLPGETSMLHLDTGNTGFMILCTSLVMLMTPGLAFFYGGLVGRKNVLAIMIQSFVSMGWTTVIWYLYGYSLCFSGDWHGIIGNLHNVCLRGIGLSTPSGPNDTIPAMVFIAYQMMFAIITPALISGAFTNRVTFKAYCLFLTAWLTFVYFPFVHMVWGGG